MAITFGASLSRCAVLRVKRVLGFASLSAAMLAHSAPVTTVVAEESFGYPGGVSLVGQNGGTGWTGAWVSDSPAFTDFFTNATGLSLPGSVGSGGAEQFSGLQAPRSMMQRAGCRSKTQEWCLSSSYRSSVLSPAGEHRTFVWMHPVSAPAALVTMGAAAVRSMRFWIRISQPCRAARSASAP